MAGYRALNIVIAVNDGDATFHVDSVRNNYTASIRGVQVQPVQAHVEGIATRGW